MSFSVNVLLYGDHLDLAKRCLESIASSADWSLISDVRIGLNAVSPTTAEYVAQWRERVPAVTRVFREKNGENVGKYPMMRRMFHAPLFPVVADRIMWFDDDSFVRRPYVNWWRNVVELAKLFSLVGSVYRVEFRGKQAAAIAAQPWYTGRKHNKHPRTGKPCFLLATGGWWIANPEILKTWDYPFPFLHHRGGDQMLGELFHQQGIPIANYNTGVAINADDRGCESRAKRRGLTPVPYGIEFNPGGSYAHQEFEIVIE